MPEDQGLLQRWPGGGSDVLRLSELTLLMSSSSHQLLLSSQVHDFHWISAPTQPGSALGAVCAIFDFKIN